jgi:hypothetical protein
VFSGHVTVTESEQEVGITGLFSVILTGLMTFLFGFLVYVKIQDRYGNKEESRRKRTN